MTLEVHLIDGTIEPVSDSFINTYLKLIDIRTVDFILYPNGEKEYNQDKYEEVTNS